MSSTRSRAYSITLLIVPLIICFARTPLAQTPASSTLRIGVYNYPHIPSAQLDETLQHVTRWFGHAGLVPRWIDMTGCAAKRRNAEAAPDCAAPDVTVIVANRDMADILVPTRTVLGLAPSTTTERGRIAYVFYDRVRALPFADAADLLAVVMAHEIGHLLLPPGSHSSSGVMRAAWHVREVRSLNLARLGFTKQQGEQIARRLAERQTALTD